MLSIRGGSGLGDSLYLQGVVRHLVSETPGIEVCTDWPDVFLPLKGKIRLSRFRRENITKIAHYTSRKAIPGTDQFQDCCLQVGISEPVEFKLDWRVVDEGLADSVRDAAGARPIVVVGLPRAPLGRKDGVGAELLPDCGVIQRGIDLIGGVAFIVQVGHGAPLFNFRGIDLDLANRTTVSGLLDVASMADGFLGYCSFIVPLAESLLKPALLVWSRRGLNSPRDFFRQITPEKIFHRPATSRAVIDDCGEDQLLEAADAFLGQVGSR